MSRPKDKECDSVQLHDEDDENDSLKEAQQPTGPLQVLSCENISTGRGRRILHVLRVHCKANFIKCFNLSSDKSKSIEFKVGLCK